jgi:hypothetical protein
MISFFLAWHKPMSPLAAEHGPIGPSLVKPRLESAGRDNRETERSPITDQIKTPAAR